MRQAGQIEAFGYHKYYRAIFLDAQELSVISFIFVTYVKMLCKHHYVNSVYRVFSEQDMVLKQNPIYHIWKSRLQGTRSPTHAPFVQSVNFAWQYTEPLFMFTGGNASIYAVSSASSVVPSTAGSAAHQPLPQ